MFCCLYSLRSKKCCKNVHRGWFQRHPVDALMGVGVWQPQTEDESCLMSRWTGPKELRPESHVSASFPVVLTSFFRLQILSTRYQDLFQSSSTATSTGWPSHQVTRGCSLVNQCQVCSFFHVQFPDKVLLLSSINQSINQSTINSI